MIQYVVCDQDGQVFQTNAGYAQHFADNPTHTSHSGACGDSASPTPYSGGSSVPEVTSDPSSPSYGQSWVLDTGSAGTAGEAMGAMGIPYSRTEVAQYQFCVKTLNGDIKRVVLI